MNTKDKLAVGASVLAVTTGLAATAASAATSTSSAVGAGTVKPHTVAAHAIAIVGTYYWNADGYTGTLVINSESQGAVTATLYDDGTTEALRGSWDNNGEVLTLVRPIWNGADDQYYTYILGGTPNQPTPQMFGGYFTQTNTGSFRYGTYLDSAL